MGVTLRDTSVIGSEGERRAGHDEVQEIGHTAHLEHNYPGTDKASVQLPARPTHMPRAKDAKRIIKGVLASRRRLLALVGILGGLLAVILLAVEPGASTRSTGAPEAGGVTTAAPEATGVSLIPGSKATAAVPGSSKDAAKTAAKKPVAKKTAGQQPVPTSSAKAGAIGSAGGAPSARSGAITTGNSKVNCIDAAFPDGVLTQSVLDGITSSTGIAYNCVNTFANPAATWTTWEQPWMFSTASDGYDAWLAASSQHQMVMGIDLIPQSAASGGDPLAWEQACDSGDYDQYATTLAKNLVSYGAGNIVIRLAPEANGTWEPDYAGTTSTEMTDWAKCYANEVTAMRAVAGTSFLFVWNPNICVADLPLSSWYPGNAYVDIIGADAYDKDCFTLKTVGQEGWQTYFTDDESASSFPSLANIESFAVANGKPMSFPEWGLTAGEDDPAYVTDMAQMFNSDDFAYQSYFDPGTNPTVAALGSSVPQATAAYAQAFK
jgi:Glycosyl hydrolase family 26